MFPLVVLTHTKVCILETTLLQAGEEADSFSEGFPVPSQLVLGHSNINKRQFS
jgi:hypothetical protein